MCRNNVTCLNRTWGQRCFCCWIFLCRWETPKVWALTIQALGNAASNYGSVVKWLLLGTPGYWSQIGTKWKKTQVGSFFCYIFTKSAHLYSSVFHHLAWLGFFWSPHAVAGIRTHVSRVVPTKDLLKDAPQTELPRRVLRLEGDGFKSHGRQGFFVKFPLKSAWRLIILWKSSSYKLELYNELIVSCV